MHAQTRIARSTVFFTRSPFVGVMVRDPGRPGRLLVPRSRRVYALAAATVNEVALRMRNDACMISRVLNAYISCSIGVPARPTVVRAVVSMRCDDRRRQGP